MASGSGVTPKGTFPQRRTSTQRTARTAHPTFPTPVGLVPFEYGSSIRQGDDEPAPSNSANFTASLGPGMDSDFRASAGISLRVVSSDSEEGAGMAGRCPQASGGLEWDYYDPSYKRRQAQLCRPPKLPLTCSQQYWL
ncbi:protein huluwa-like [Chrysemys picta bellii]|uniref:protein huluwa-like n=1 Tax=Chrysemys picta bellii TaxID=8478 RepID=UPI0032B302E4